MALLQSCYENATRRIEPSARGWCLHSRRWPTNLRSNRPNFYRASCYRSSTGFFPPWRQHLRFAASIAGQGIVGVERVPLFGPETIRTIPVALLLGWWDFDLRGVPRILANPSWDAEHRLPLLRLLQRFNSRQS